MALLVQKFGGSSLRDTERIRAAADRIARTVGAGDEVVVTVSAMGNETDELLELAPRVSSVRPGREMDMLITSGERKAAALVCLALEELGIATKGLSGSQAGIATDGDHTRARIVDIRPQRIRRALDEGFVPVVGGAQGASDTDDDTFLGRGGTDTTAVALAFALDADACELYTDVRGIYTADPRVVSEARLLPRLSFDQMAEMCAAGCPKPAARAVALARARGVALHVRSAETEEPGTWIDAGDIPGRPPPLAVVADPGQVKLSLTGVRDGRRLAERLSDVFADRDVRCDSFVHTAEAGAEGAVSVAVAKPCLSVACDAIDALKDELGPFGCGVDSAVAKVSLVGPGLDADPALSARMAQALARDGIGAELLAPSAMRLSWMVRGDHASRATAALHRAAYPDRAEPEIGVAGNGTGTHAMTGSDPHRCAARRPAGDAVAEPREESRA